MNLIKFAKLTLATLAAWEVVRSNSPVYLPVGVAKAATVATAVVTSRLPDEYLDPIAAVGVLTIANKYLDVDMVPEWGRNLNARWNGMRQRWYKWRGLEPGVVNTAPTFEKGARGWSGQRVPRLDED